MAVMFVCIGEEIFQVSEVLLGCVLLYKFVQFCPPVCLSVCLSLSLSYFQKVRISIRTNCLLLLLVFFVVVIVGCWVLLLLDWVSFVVVFFWGGGRCVVFCLFLFFCLFFFCFWFCFIFLLGGLEVVCIESLL